LRDSAASEAIAVACGTYAAPAQGWPSPGDRPAEAGRGAIMGWYNDVVLPRLLDQVMRKEDLAEYHRRVIGAAQGRILEIGIGSGLNLPFYGAQVTEIVGLEPSQASIDMADRRARSHDRKVSFLRVSRGDPPRCG
jgi:SAM-dependent methyltransferase